MTKSTLIILVVLLCLWASGSMASRVTIVALGSSPQVSIQSGLFSSWIGPSLTLAVPIGGALPLNTPVGGGQSEKEEEDIEDPGPPVPSPVRPDIHGDLSGEEQEPPAPPGP